MKKILSVLVVLIMLLPGAFANVVSQSNVGSASGAGCQGIINQDAFNVVVAVGSGNDVTQQNDQSADSMGCFFVDQMAANAVLAFGNGNSIFQSNFADGMGGVALQKQLNAIVALGCGNTASQSNYAKAVEELPYSYIMQCQSNLGIVAGKNNQLTQSNYADAALPKKCDKIDIDPVILQVQANNALQMGNRNTMFQGNTAVAEIQACTDAGGCLAVGEYAPGYAYMWDDGSEFGRDSASFPMSYATMLPATTYSSVYQFQNNNGVQIGKGNTMFQNNFAKAKIAFAASIEADASAEGCSGALAVAGPEADASADAIHYASADAAASAVVDPTTVVQNQNNNGMQVGKFNFMIQSNVAMANIEAVAYAEATANAEANSWAASEAPSIWLFGWHPSNADASAFANAYAAAQANAYVGSNTITQDQANNGMQIGKFNTMIQSNFASADIGAWAWAKANANADAYSAANALGVPCLGDAYAYADSQACAAAIAQAILDPNTIEQNQVNSGVQLGKLNTMMQGNCEVADIKAFVDAKAESSAYATSSVLDNPIFWQSSASAGASAMPDGTYTDTSKQKGYATSYSSANSEDSAYHGQNLIVQNQENTGLELGKGGLLVQRNNAKAIIPKIPTLDPLIIQNQANLGTLISTCQGVEA